MRLTWMLVFLAVAMLRGSSLHPADDRVLGPLTFQVFTEQDGIPQRSIFALNHDGEGRLWAGTLSGLGVFDGHQWKPAPLPNSSQAVFVNANAITPLADGRIWVGTRHQGLLEGRNGTWRTLLGPEGLAAENINAILESRVRGRDGQPVRWVATYGKGAARLADGAWTLFPDVGGDGRLFALLERREGVPGPAVWAGTTQGLWSFDGTRWTAFPDNAKLPDRRVRALAETWDADGSSSLWIGTEQGGLVRLKQGRLEAVPLGTLPATGRIRALLTDPSSHGRALWVGDLGGGVARWDQGAWETLGTAEGLPSATVRCLAMTPGGPHGWVLWIGTEARGLIRHAGEGWRRLAAGPPSSDPRVQSFAQSADGTLWLGTPNHGLASLNQGIWRTHPRPPGLPPGEIRCLYSFPGDSDVFLGTYQGLAQFDKGRWRTWTPKEGLPSATIRVLTGTREPDGTRKLWLGTSRGLVFWDGRRFTTVPAPPGLSDFSVRCLLAEGKRLWVGGERGLACLENDRWISFPFMTELQKTVVYTVAVQPSASGGTTLWIGTMGQGLILVEDLARPDTLRALTTRSDPALAHDVVSSLAAGPDGWVYAATPRGVQRLRLQSGAVDSDPFSQADGLPGLECVEGALLAAQGGRIWVGTMDGAAYLDAWKRPFRRHPNTLVWHEARDGAHRLEPGAVLDHRPHRLAFSFQLLSSHRETDTRFRTQLLGLQAEPEPWSGAHEVRFPTLPSGRYTLLVWAKDYRGTLSGPIQFPFEIKRAPWLTNLALMGYVLLLGGTLATLIRFRLRVLGQRNQELEAAVQRATAEVLQQKQDLERLNQELLALNRDKNRFIGIAAHDLKNPLNAICLMCEGLLSGEIEECPPNLRPWIQRTDRAAKDMTGLILEFLDITAIESGRMQPELSTFQLAESIEAVCRSNAHKASTKGQTLLVTPEPNDLVVHADARHLLQILENLVSNAVKYSPRQAEIQIRITASPDWVRVSVVDQGPGLSEEDLANLFKPFTRLQAKPTGGESSTGLGLSIAKHLAEAMGCRIWAENAPDRGASFTVEIPRRVPG